MKKKLQINKQIKEEKKEEETSVNNIKIGHFQLQTKSFWLSLVSLLCGFIMFTSYVNYKMMQSVLKHNEETMTIILNHFERNKE